MITLAHPETATSSVGTNLIIVPLEKFKSNGSETLCAF